MKEIVKEVKWLSETTLNIEYVDGKEVQYDLFNNETRVYSPKNNQFRYYKGMTKKYAKVIQNEIDLRNANKTMETLEEEVDELIAYQQEEEEKYIKAMEVQETEEDTIKDSQLYSSANTSLNQVPKVFKGLNLPKGSFIFDYGCGKYDLAKEYCEERGWEYFGYDKYNRSESQNDYALDWIDCCDYIVCANVLNVLDDNTIDIVIHDLLYRFRSNEAIGLLIQVYEGDKSGIGRITKENCYQRNEKVKEYLKRIKAYEGEQLNVHGNVITLTNIENSRKASRR